MSRSSTGSISSSITSSISRTGSHWTDMSTSITSGYVIRKGYEISSEQPAESRTAPTISSIVQPSAFIIPLTPCPLLKFSLYALLTLHYYYIILLILHQLTRVLLLITLFLLILHNYSLAPLPLSKQVDPLSNTRHALVDHTRAPLTLIPHLKYHCTPL